MSEIVLGIDFGNSNSVAAYYDGYETYIIPPEIKSKYGDSFPTVISFQDDGSKLYGQDAKDNFLVNSEKTIFRIKKLLKEDKNIIIGDKEYSPTELAAYILQYIKKCSEKEIGEEIKKVVVTVPANYKDKQRNATKDAASIAGFEDISFIHEPTAAILDYQEKHSIDGKFMVYDMGAGTLDVTIVDVKDKVFKVESVTGADIGGFDFDDVIVKYCADNFKEEHGINLEEDEFAMSKLKEKVEDAKIELSTELETDIRIPNIAEDEDFISLHFNMTLTREKLNELIKKTVLKSETVMKKALREADLRNEDIDKIILVGGPTNMPIVRECVENFMKKSPERGIDPMECVASGAAIKGFHFTPGEDEKIIGPLEIYDIVPYSLGIELNDDKTSVIIEKGSNFPIKKSNTYKTTIDDQTSTDIKVFQGESVYSINNDLIGEFVFDGITKAPKAKSKIKVTIGYDKDGIITVSAMDVTSGHIMEKTLKEGDSLVEASVWQLTKKFENNRKVSDCLDEVKSTLYEIERVISKPLDDFSRFELEDIAKKDLEDNIKKLNRINTEDATEVDEIIEEVQKTINNAKETLNELDLERGGLDV